MNSKKIVNRVENSTSVTHETSLKMLIRKTDYQHQFFQISNQINATNHDFDEEDDTYKDTLLSNSEIKKPPMYAVIMLNDDFTPMDFVVEVLQQLFGHDHDDAMSIMFNIHHNGKGTAGIYPRGIAETKANMVNSTSISAGYPLLTEIEALSD